MGAATMAPLIRRLCPHAEIQSRERYSQLTYAGPKKLTRLPPRSAVVAFSADAVYAIAELIRRHRGGAAVVMGSLSPRTRNAQVELFQSGEVDFLVATDAIGMGLNMDVDHVAFAGLAQVRRAAHRAGSIPRRSARSPAAPGASAATAPSASPATLRTSTADAIAAVEGHVFAPLMAAEWRNARLDFQSLAGLMRSLAEPPPTAGLRLSEESQDETTLRQLALDETVIRRCRDRANLIRLWEACQTPDFRKTTQDEHARLIGDHVRAPDATRPAAARGLDAGPVRQPRPARGRHRRALGAPRPRAHARLCRQPRRLARRSRRAGRAEPARWRTGSPTPCTSG